MYTYWNLVLDMLHKLNHDSRNVCGCLNLDEMYIELASLIISSINENLTNTSSTSSPEVYIYVYIYIYIYIIYSKFNDFVYLNRPFHLLKI